MLLRTLVGSPRRIGTLVGLGMLTFLVGCAASRPSAPASAPVAHVDYAKSVLLRGRHGGGGIAVLSSPEGDVLFVANGAGVDEVDGENGTVRRTHAAALSAVANVHRDGTSVVLVSTSDNRVLVWDPARDVVVEDHGGFVAPVSALRFDGALMIVEQGRGSIARQGRDDFSADTFVTGMRAPAGIAATKGSVWVTDWASGTLLQVVANNERLVEPIEVANGLAQPEGLGVTPDGALVVAESGAGRLSRIDPHSRSVAVIDDQLALDADSGYGTNPTGSFAGVAIGACGTIYVVADLSGEIIRYVPQGQVVCQYGE
jgi:sugar lactone lactonase YvrE